MLPDWWLLRWLLGSAVAAWCVTRLLARRRRKCRRPLRGRTVFVSGATSGLGEALACELVARGARVVLGGRDAAKLAEIAERLVARGAAGAEVKTVRMDLSAADEELGEAGAALRIWEAAGGQLDVVVNNAGQSYRGEILTTAAGVHRQLMQVNYFGHVALTTGLCRLAVASNRSLTVVGISSLQGLLSQPYRSAYAAAKHAFQAFHDCLRAELAAKGFRVLTVSPAYISTALSVNALTGSGAAYSRTDESTRKGMSPERAAAAVLDAIECDERTAEEVLLGPWHMRAAPLLRRLLPWVMFRVMERRAGSGGVTK